LNDETWAWLKRFGERFGNRIGVPCSPAHDNAVQTEQFTKIVTTGVYVFQKMLLW